MTSPQPPIESIKVHSEIETNKSLRQVHPDGGLLVQGSWHQIVALVASLPILMLVFLQVSGGTSILALFCAAYYYLPISMTQEKERFVSALEITSLAGVIYIGKYAGATLLTPIGFFTLIGLFRSSPGFFLQRSFWKESNLSLLSGNVTSYLCFGILSLLVCQFSALSLQGLGFYQLVALTGLSGSLVYLLAEVDYRRILKLVPSVQLGSMTFASSSQLAEHYQDLKDRQNRLLEEIKKMIGSTDKDGGLIESLEILTENNLTLMDQGNELYNFLSHSRYRELEIQKSQTEIEVRNENTAEMRSLLTRKLETIENQLARFQELRSEEKKLHTIVETNLIQLGSIQVMLMENKTRDLKDLRKQVERLSSTTMESLQYLKDRQEALLEMNS